LKKTVWAFLFAGVSVHAQNFTEREFGEHLLKSVKDSLYLISTEYPATGISLRLNSTQALSDSTFIVVGPDTLYFQPDRENEPEGNYNYSNLLTFPAPVDSFYFHPGGIEYPIDFIFINATIPTDKSPVRKKKTRNVQNP